MRKALVITLLAMSALILGAAEPVNLIQKRPWRVMNSAKNTIVDNIGKEYHCIGDGKTGEGVFQVYYFKTPVTGKFIFSAESKLSGVPAGKTIPASFYAIYVDVAYADGTRKFGLLAPFKYSNHDWEKAQLEFTPPKPVARMNIHLLFRRAQGKASFRNGSMMIVK